MNIESAKKEIRRTLRAYRKTLPDGSLKIPVEKQRPLLMIGPPGIGKTAIMKQIAEETGEGLVAYSMTHHTRQSAIGLPVIEKKMYGGVEQTVTEYTMSEIVASLYDYIETTGKTRGILFLDEINCVSETLTPVMLQLLQNKTFGTHSLPEGWIIVAAGNPPEYNRAVREFDMATVDRVKNMDIEPDLPVWQRYARKQHIHPAICTYLSVYPENFYVIREVDRQQTFVTARGWEDLSLMIESCEEDGDAVDEEMIRQYLRDPRVAHDFASFYTLFHGFGMTWNIDGEKGEGPHFRAFLQAAGEQMRDIPEVSCLALSGMLFAELQTEAHEIMERCRTRQRMEEILKMGFFHKPEEIRKDTQKHAFFRHEEEELERRQKLGRYQASEAAREKRVLRRLESDLDRWLMGCRTEEFPVWESAALAGEDEAEKSLREDFPAHVEEAKQILAGCRFGETALRYLEADLAGDEDASALI